jgi:hypothetical protein
MFSLFWIFAGFLVGLLVSVVFTPPLRNIPDLPTPDETDAMHTGAGCVKFVANEVPCTPDKTSLNFVASHK